MPKKTRPYDLDELKKIRLIAIQAMFSDDFLLDNLVLKGGNALDLVYKLGSRSSMDIDFSIGEDFDSSTLGEIEKKIESVLVNTFSENGYMVIDFRFTQKPQPRPDDEMKFWGGYVVKFKVIRGATSESVIDVSRARKAAFPLGEGERKALIIEISKFEFVETKAESELDGLVIYIYTPEMILFEKLRAICQQTDEYSEIIKRPYPCKARAKDFYDIVVVFDGFGIDVLMEGSLSTLKAIFKSKNVPLALLGKIESSRELHRQDFKSVESTVLDRTKLQSFDYYFDRVIEIVRPLLKPLGIE